MIQRSLKVFLLFFVIYLFTWGGHYTSGDGAEKITWAKVMLFGTSASPRMNLNSDGVWSRYGIGHSLIAMPALATSSSVEKHTGIHCEAVLYTLIFVGNGALLLALIAYYLFHFYDPKRVWWTIAIVGLATTWWPYTKMDFSEPLVATILFGGFVLMRFGNPTFGMFLAALAITIRSDAAIPVFLLFLWWFFQKPNAGTLLKLSLAIVPSIAIAACANYVRYHSVFDHGYPGMGFTTPLILGLVGVLFSGGKSIFLFSPPLILGFLGWKRFRERLETQTDALLFMGIFIAELLIYAKWWNWSSDDAWGIRFMIPGVVLMSIPLIEVLERRWLTAIVVTAGISVQLLAVLVGGLDYLMMIRSHQAERQALYVTGNDRIDFEDVRFNPQYSQIAGNWILLRCLLHIPPRSRRSTEFVEKNGTPLYDSMPSQVWSEAARWDFVWTRNRK